MLGASLVDWENNGSYFYVSTTNYFQEDNKISKYDYFGRLIEEKKYKSLVSSTVYGAPEPFIQLTAPDEILVPKTEKYIPPHLRQPESSVKPKKKVEKPAQAMPKPEPVRTKADVEKDLQRVADLKEQLKNGVELSITDINFILKEGRLKVELGKFNE